MSNAFFNPYGHPVEAELPHPIATDKNWTEHYYFWAFDPAKEYGIYIHAGRLLSDSTIWRPVIQIFLPNEAFLVTTLHGRGGDLLGPGVGGLKLNCIDPHRTWSVHFDGVGYRTSRRELMQGPISERPVEPVRFSLLFDGAAPNYGEHPWGDTGVAKFHTEQISRVRGHIAHNGKVIPMEGVGARDHSTGPRDYASVVGDLWFQCLFEDGDAIMVQVVRFEAKSIQASYFYKAGAKEIEKLEILEHPLVPAWDAKPGQFCRDPIEDKEWRNFVIRLKRTNGEEIRLDCSLITACAVTLTSPLEEEHGTGRGLGLQMCECAAKVRWGQKVGYANRERSSRLSALTPPSDNK